MPQLHPVHDHVRHGRGVDGPPGSVNPIRKDQPEQNVSQQPRQGEKEPLRTVHVPEAHGPSHNKSAVCRRSCAQADKPSIQALFGKHAGGDVL
jgi:hypothetical protein